MEKYYFDFEKTETPKYIQIVKNLKKLIDSNMVEDGEKLPPIRKLSKILGVNTVTIINAYDKLEAEGYAMQKMGSGTYAKKKDMNRSFKRQYSETFKRISAEELKQYIDFTGETACSEYFPVTTFKEVLDEVLDRDGAEALMYQESLGYDGLRKSINKCFWENKQEEDSILIISGAQQGIDIISKVLINVYDNVIIEKPTYSGAISVFKGRRANIFEAEMQEDGVNIEQFEAFLKKNKIKCFYAMSYFQNPTGMTYSLEKKLKILELANIYDFYIIEDDYLSELIYDPNIQYASFKNLDKNDRVIYIKSFSKIFLPGIRIGYAIIPSEFSEQAQNSKINTDISTSSLMQRALDLYIKRGYWKEYINYLNEEYNKKYVSMVELIESILKDKVEFNKPGGGLSIYLKISNNINVNSTELFYKCKAKKVLIAPGTLFYKNAEDGSKYFRIGFSNASIEQMKAGFEIIENILI